MRRAFSKSSLVCSTAATTRGLFTASRPALAIVQDQAELAKEEKMLGDMKSKYSQLFTGFDPTKYANTAHQQGSGCGSCPNNSANGGNCDQSTQHNSTAAGGNNANTGGNPNNFDFNPFGNMFGKMPGGGGANNNNQQAARGINDVPMFLTGLILLWCSYKLLKKKQNEQTNPTIPLWCTSVEQQAKYMLYVASIDATQRKALQNEFDAVRRQNPMMPFFDWLDQRLPAWGFGTRYSRYQAIESFVNILRLQDNSKLGSLTSTVSSVGAATLDPAAKVDKMVDTNNGSGGFMSGLFGGSNDASASPVPTPPPQAGGVPMYQQQQFNPAYTQHPVPAYGGAPYGSVPAAAPGYSVGGDGNPGGTNIAFRDVISGAGEVSGQPHGTDPFARDNTAPSPTAVNGAVPTDNGSSGNSNNNGMVSM